MTSTPESWTPTSHVEPDFLTSIPLTLRADNSALLPNKPALPNGLAILRRTRFAVPADEASAVTARAIFRPTLPILLGPGDDPRLPLRIETCLSELVTMAYTCTTSQAILCAAWTDSDHVFLSVEHDNALPLAPDDSTVALTTVKSIADDYGTHRENGVHQTWAAVRRR